MTEPSSPAAQQPIARAPHTRGASASLWVLLASGFATLLLCAAWLWMAKEREHGYGYRLVSYPEAYLPTERPTLESVRFAGEQLTLTLEGTRKESHRVTVPVGLAEHAVRVDGFGGAAQRFQTSRGPSGPPIFASAALVHANGARFSLRDHVADLEDYPSEHVAAVRTLITKADLASSVGSTDSTDKASTLDRFRSLWLWLHAQLGPHAGPPPPDFQQIAPFDQYTRAMRGEMKLFCANYAEILTLFATVAGFSVRVVDLTGAVTGTPMSAHTFVELYVPELGRFVYTDLTLRLFVVRLGAGGPPLDSAQIMQVAQMDGSGALVVEVVRDAGLLEVPMREGPERLAVFVNPNAVLVFHQQYRDRFTPLHRLLRYVLAGEPAYALNQDGARFRLRMRVQLAMLALGLVTLVLTLRYVNLVRALRR